MTDSLLRPVTDADVGQILQWRNHPEVRRYMYTTHEIGLEEHRRWFSAAIENPELTLLIYEHCGVPSGFVKFTQGCSRKLADWGFYVSPEASRGTGRQLGYSSLVYAFGELGFVKLCGQVLCYNERSLAFHRSLGFTEEGRLRKQHFDGSTYHDVILFGMLKSEWLSAPERGAI